MKTSGYGSSTTGRRPDNEDAFWVECFRRPVGCIQAVAVVCDGMGGQRAGRTASREAVEMIRTRLKLPPSDEQRVAHWIEETVAAIQDRLVNAGRHHPQLAGMGTTLVMAVVCRQWAWVAHVGDSRAYRVDLRRPRRLTVDHTAVQDAINRGLYDAADVRHNPALGRLSSALVRNLGEGGDPSVDITRFRISGREVLILCSDGLTGSIVEPVLDGEEIYRQIHGTPDLETAVHNLLSLAYQEGSTDNITVAMLEIGSLPRAGPPVAKQPDVETLHRAEQRLLVKRRRRERRRRFYRRLIKPLTGILLVLCVAAVFVIRHQVMPPPTRPEQPASLPRPAAAQASGISKEAPLRRAVSEKPLAINWSRIYDKGEKLRFDDYLQFTVHDGGNARARVLLIAGRDPGLKTDPVRAEVAPYIKGSSGSLRPADVGIRQGRWYLRLVLETPKQKVESDLLRLDIVGK